MKSIRIASRASKLALVQTDIVRKLLEDLHPDIRCSIVRITTQGDRDKSDFLYQAESRGLFTSEVENALLDGRADLAVHSFKDLPTLAREALVIAAVPKRESPADAVVAREKINSLEDLPPGVTIGTSSLRRIAQLKLFRNDINCIPLRGNVETRVRKVTEGKVDAIVIACAGLNRLGLAEKISVVLPPKEFIPAPAQGALAVQIRADDEELASLVSKIDDTNSRIAVEIERCVLETVHGGCSIPLGVYSRIYGDTITIDAILCDLDGKNYVKRSVASFITEAKSSARDLARRLLTEGGEQILEKIRKGTK
ncbi:MAG: hydroxymethylbilane synthase [Sedimentisphaerales bacterium]|nr:hydroxymethylbilane synthase [Sedimentisphaerales bacterium]